jgi:hypothetical protein
MSERVQLLKLPYQYTLCVCGGGGYSTTSFQYRYYIASNGMEIKELERMGGESSRSLIDAIS